MRKFAACLAVSVLLSVSVHPVRAQAGSTGIKMPGTWGTSINLQNTSSTQANSIVITFFDSNGTSAKNETLAPLAGNGSRSIYVPTQVAGLASGQYSAVVSSDQPLQVIANSGSYTGLSDPNAMGLVSYLGVSNPSTTLFFPGLYKSYFGFNSEIVLQNTTSQQATNVSIQIYNQKTGALVTTLSSPNTNIPANSTRSFAMEDYAGITSGNANGLLAARVTSDQALAGIANIWSTTTAGQTSSYNAFPSGANVFYAPALYKSYFKFNSALTVQNVGGSPANIRVTYSNGTTKETTLQPFQSIEYYQPADAALPSGNAAGVFSAKVESLNGQALVGLVSINDGKVFDSYNGIIDVGTNGVGCPVTLQSFFNYFSSETVQNLGSVATTVTATYATGQVRVSPSIPPNGTYNFLELQGQGTVLPNGSSVAVTFTSSNGQPLAAVTQQNYLQVKAGDSLSSYSCVKK